jgi:hypothetical protein
MLTRNRCCRSWDWLRTWASLSVSSVVNSVMFLVTAVLSQQHRRWIWSFLERYPTIPTLHIFSMCCAFAQSAGACMMINQSNPQNNATWWGGYLRLFRVIWTCCNGLMAGASEHCNPRNIRCRKSNSGSFTLQWSGNGVQGCCSPISC